jgi:hypothetical protein
MLHVLLQLASQNAQALDLLSQPTALLGTLMRETYDPGQDPEGQSTNHTRTIATMVWRPFSEGDEGSDVRNKHILAGEILVPGDVASSTNLGPYSISVSIFVLLN